MTGRGGAQAVEEFPSFGKGRERGPSKRRKQRDRRKRLGWDESSPSRGATEGARQTRDRVADSGARLEVWWLEPDPSQEMKFYRKEKKLAGFRGEGAKEDSKIGTTGGLGRGDGLTIEMCIFLNLC